MEQQDKIVFITFDLDFTNYLKNIYFDEFQLSFSLIQNTLIQNPDIKTTWFIRIDRQIEQIFGYSDYYFNKHIEKINWLKKNNHCIAWHHHSYIKNLNNKWVQNINESVILKEVEKYGKIALEKGLNICRMGWGFQTNKTMKLLSDMGFLIDSSAIPKPNYKWDLSVKDWSKTTSEWYHPSENDYMIPGEPSLGIFEVPITTTTISVQTDTEQNVIRYLNPAYKEDIFQKALNQLSNLNKIITITHPYELIVNKKKHSLLNFNIRTFVNNINTLKNNNYIFQTLNVKK